MMLPSDEIERFRRELAAKRLVLERPRPDVEVRIPLRTRNRANASQGTTRLAMLHRAKERKDTREIVGWCLKGTSPPALPCVVLLQREGTTGRLDTDGLATATKSVRDQVAIWLGLPRNRRGHADDADPRVTWLYAQETGRKEHAIRIGVWRRDEE